MSTTTPNLGLTKPDPNGDDDAWAPMLNGNADILDTQVQAALDDAAQAIADAAAADANADTRLLASLVSAAALTVLDDTTVAAMRTTLGATTVGGNVFTASNAAAARSAMGAAPTPTASPGVSGEWRSANTPANTASVLPAGGTWAYVLFITASGTTIGIQAVGVAAGGTTVGAAPGAGNAYNMFCWRIA